MRNPVLDGLPWDAALLHTPGNGTVIPIAKGGTVNYSSQGGNSEFISSMGRRTVFARSVDVREWQFKQNMMATDAEYAYNFSRSKQRYGFLVTPWARRHNFLAPAPESRDEWDYGKAAEATKTDDSFINGLLMRTWKTNGTTEVKGPLTPVVAGATISYRAYVSNGYFYVVGLDVNKNEVWFPQKATTNGYLGHGMVRGVTVPKNSGIRYIREVYKGNEFTLGSVWYGDHAANPVEREGAWVTMEEFSYDHGNAPESPVVNVSFTLKEVTP